MQSTELIKAPKLYKRFVVSLFILNLFAFTSRFELYIDIPKIIKYIFSLVAIYYIIGLFRSSRKLKIYNKVDNLVRILFIIVSIYLLLTSFRFEIFYVQEVFGERFFFMPYLIPVLFILIRYNLLFFKVLLKYTYQFIFFAIFVEVLILLFFRDESYYAGGMSSIFAFSIAPMLLIQVSHLNNKINTRKVAFLYFILFAIITAFWGRRGETIESIFFLIAALVITMRSQSIGMRKKIAFMIISIFISIAAFYIVNENQDNILIFQRGISMDSFDQSRGETITNFLLEFGSKPYDLYIGRGLNGEFRKFTFGDNQMSRSIEIGYFNILLKGGILYLIPMMYLFFRAFFLGFFRSNNDLSKGLALIILWQIIYMVSFGMADYSPKYILIWIAVGASFDPDLRLKSNSDLKAVINSR